jgi:hypothetical protein
MNKKVGVATVTVIKAVFSAVNAISGALIAAFT